MYVAPIVGLLLTTGMVMFVLKSGLGYTWAIFLQAHLVIWSNCLYKRQRLIWPLFTKKKRLKITSLKVQAVAEKEN
jgi:hypothetical protein